MARFHSIILFLLLNGTLRMGKIPETRMASENLYRKRTATILLHVWVLFRASCRVYVFHQMTYLSELFNDTPLRASFSMLL
uniref:Uncharacterized protein n=1 Tax=Pristionchus pacificus TaxID=54126 RepID=A0A2A6C3H9_PRIPA|eukprot:PDM72792.1 hypothetical protein PRIPAC_39226 [Pristionchus pacificus]